VHNNQPYYNCTIFQKSLLVLVALVACVFAKPEAQDQEAAELYFRTYGYVSKFDELCRGILFNSFPNFGSLSKQYPSWYSGYAYSGYPSAYNYGYAGKYYGYY